MAGLRLVRAGSCGDDFLVDAVVVIVIMIKFVVSVGIYVDRGVS